MFKSVLSLTLAAALGTASFGQTTLTAIPGEAAAAKYASISQEILRAIEKGNEYLKSKQKSGRLLGPAVLPCPDSPGGHRLHARPRQPGETRPGIHPEGV